MAPRGSWNPIAFVPLQVSLISSAVYIALFAFLIYTHHHVPASPGDPVPVEGLNLTQAWLDLAYVSDGFHPVDSRRNELVRAYVLDRVEGILEGKGVGWKIVSEEVEGEGVVGEKKGKGKKGKEEGPKAVTVFQDDRSNVTFVDDWRQTPWTCYQESTNVMVYIRGEDDGQEDWWEKGRYNGNWGVLMNAHYDSVSSGYGATDDGVGVVTLLQLISYFTTEGNRPKRGIVALFNNGEENGLYGAHNYLRHPLSQFTHTFLNLEGAGGGGRAVLFRSTDAEVTKFYAASPRPFGSVVVDDGFKRGLVKSGTDYSVFNGDNGMRGLDVAFFEPRSRYHTDQDDAKNTSPDSVWHMLSTALATMKAMTSYSGDAFDGPVQKNGRLDIGKGSNAVWFDIFNRTFALLKLPTLVALSVTLLVAGPVILIILQVILSKSDKWYPLTKKQHPHSSDDDETVHFSGMRGLLRFPIAFIVATAAVLALAYLVTKINPLVVYSSQYAVWAMMLSAHFSLSWFFLAGADRVRPTALHRFYCLIWLFALSWVVLVAVTVGENRYQIASGYLMVIYNACVFVALLVSYLELFSLPKKADHVERMASGGGVESSRPGSRSSRDVLNAGEGRSRDPRAEDDEEADERTSLLRGRERRTGNTFKGIAKRQTEDDGADEAEEQTMSYVYGDEQAWSSSLPRWTWIVQLLVLVPINVILVGQVALLTTSALHQTPADGSSPLTVYLLLALLTTLLLLPLTPFLHRFVYQIPTFLFLIFVGCLIYNLLAFPFSRDARLKVFFAQTVDLNTGINNVTLTGLDGYVQEVIDELPSSTGKAVDCDAGSADPLRASLRSCSWHGLPPNVLSSPTTEASSLAPYSNHTLPPTTSWLTYNVTSNNASSALFTFRGNNTKACRLVFSNPISDVSIADAASDPRYRTTTNEGSTQVRLFSRDWDKTFRVNVTWDGEAKGQTGKVVCLWSDANVHGTIPAYDELRRFAPVWAAGTKAGDGLVEGWKGFKV